MTKLLAKVMREVSELPEERQEDVAHVIRAMLDNDALHFDLSEEQLLEVDKAMADTKGGHFAGEQEIEEALHRPWT